jgi:hypothetical protein
VKENREEKMMPRQSPGIPIAFLAAAIATFAPVLGCAQKQGDRFLKVFFPNGTAVAAEIAAPEDVRARGLMFRDALPIDQGMLFVFEEEGVHAFWMKNTRIPLDMLWLDPGRRIVHIAKMVPPCVADPCPSYGPGLPALFVLELAGGQADARGLKVGDRLEFVLPPGLVRR